MRDTALMPEKSRPSSQEASVTRHALVVDDMPVMAKILGRALDEMGITYDHVMNGEEAVTAFEAGRYDMVFMDIMMPKMNGVEATKRLRALESEANRSPLPIIAVTTKMSGPENSVYLGAGMTDCIKKPVDRVSLEVLVKRHLTGEEADVDISDQYDAIYDEMEVVNWDTFPGVWRASEGLNELYFDLHIAFEHTRQALQKKLIILKNF